MADVLDEVKAQFHEVAGILKASFFRLGGVVASLPLSPQELSREDIEGDAEPHAHARAVALCVMNDYLRPAVRDLLAAAVYQPGEPPAPANGFYDLFQEVFATPIPLTPGGNGREEK